MRQPLFPFASRQSQTAGRWVDSFPLQGSVMRPVVVLLLLLLSISAGCLSSEDVSEVDAGEALFDIAIGNGDAWNLVRAVDGADAYRIIIEDQLDQVSSRVVVGVDRNVGISQVSMLNQIGNETLDFDLFESEGEFHVRIADEWYVGRDAVSHSFDPLVGLDSTFGSQGIPSPSPSLPMDSNEFPSLDWRVTWDPSVEQMVAVTDNASHQLILELRGSPPVLVKAESYSLDGLSSTVLEVVIGDAASISIPDVEMERMPAPISGQIRLDVVDGYRIWEYTIADGFRWEVDVNEMELHAGTRDSEGALVIEHIFPLESGHLETSDSNGDSWTFDHVDLDEDGYLSGGDLVRVTTNSTIDLDAAFYDKWAEAYPESFLPASPLAPLVLLFVAILRGIRPAIQGRD